MVDYGRVDLWKSLVYHHIYLNTPRYSPYTNYITTWLVKWELYQMISPLYPQGYPLVCLQPLPPKTQVQDEENPKEDARVPVWLLRSNVILNNKHEDLESTTDLGWIKHVPWAAHFMLHNFHPRSMSPWFPIFSNKRPQLSSAFIVVFWWPIKPTQLSTPSLRHCMR